MPWTDVFRRRNSGETEDYFEMDMTEDKPKRKNSDEQVEKQKRQPQALQRPTAQEKVYETFEGRTGFAPEDSTARQQLKELIQKLVAVRGLTLDKIEPSMVNQYTFSLGQKYPHRIEYIRSLLSEMQTDLRAHEFNRKIKLKPDWLPVDRAVFYTTAGYTVQDPAALRLHLEACLNVDFSRSAKQVKSVLLNTLNLLVKRQIGSIVIKDRTVILQAESSLSDSLLKQMNEAGYENHVVESGWDSHLISYSDQVRNARMKLVLVNAFATNPEDFSDLESLA